MSRIPIRAWASVLAATALLAAPAAAVTQPPRPAAPPAAAAPTPPGPRVIYRLEVIRTGPLPPEVIAKLAPIHTMADVETLLKSGDHAFAWRRQDLDSATASPQFVKSLESLPPDDLFAIPQADGVLIGRIVGRRMAP